MSRRALVSMIYAGILGKASGNCACKWQNKDLPAATYTSYPTSVPGKYNKTAYPNVPKYGTMCAAWDVVDGTPWYASCTTSVTDYSTSSKNWCQIPWCYVDSSCSTAVSTSLFSGSSDASHYSYGACGGAKDCYNTFNQAGCPYDPSSEGDYKVFKNSCKCKYHGSKLPQTLLDNYPSSNAGKYKNYANINIYGTTCAAWDASPGTPWKSYCPNNADWCSYQKNWCQLPWCYVDSSCTTAVASSVFSGSTDASHYSYDTCLSTPDCYTNSAKGKRGSLPASCPFDSTDNSWYTAKTCANGFTDEDMCDCLFQGQDLPSNVYTSYPSSQPGKYSVANGYTHIAKYGTMCAAWDQVAGTPYHASSCSGSKNNWANTSAQNWCQLPWCYVSDKCAGASLTGLFSGSSQVKAYSYGACGNTPDCYNSPSMTGCPYDPSNELDYKTHKSSCPCKYQGTVLPTSILTGYPTTDPGKWNTASYPNIAIYGTTCAAWDQSPKTPWYSYCPSGSDWCAYDKNWCQLPWCYVDSSCTTKIASSVFKGSNAAYYSYDTCLSTPDCYSNYGPAVRNNLPSACPFDKNDNKWYTAKVCSSYTAVEPISANTASGMAISGAGIMAAAAACAA